MSTLGKVPLILKRSSGTYRGTLDRSDRCPRKMGAQVCSQTLLPTLAASTRPAAPGGGWHTPRLGEELDGWGWRLVLGRRLDGVTSKLPSLIQIPRILFPGEDSLGRNNIEFLAPHSFLHPLLYSFIPSVSIY